MLWTSVLTNLDKLVYCTLVRASLWQLDLTVCFFVSVGRCIRISIAGFTIYSFLLWTCYCSESYCKLYVLGLLKSSAHQWWHCCLKADAWWDDLWHVDEFVCVSVKKEQMSTLDEFAHLWKIVPLHLHSQFVWYIFWLLLLLFQVCAPPPGEHVKNLVWRMHLPLRFQLMHFVALKLYPNTNHHCN